MLPPSYKKKIPMDTCLSPLPYLHIYMNRQLVKEVLTMKKKQHTGCLFPRYRWCGPHCSGPGTPINDVDVCCKRHDLCIMKGGSRCYCDTMFINCLHSKVNYHTKKGRQAALMYHAMKLNRLLTCR
jgi:hypothetical protein